MNYLKSSEILVPSYRSKVNVAFAVHAHMYFKLLINHVLPHR